MADKKRIDPFKIKTVSINERRSKVDEAAFASPVQAGMSFRGWLDSLPDILAARDIKEVANAIVVARKGDRPVILGMGAHVIKAGLSPLIISMMENGVITCLAMNGACLVHDLEVALCGSTSEDVAEALDTGMFGMTKETAEGLNRAAARCGTEEVGLGRAVGQALLEGEFPYKQKSLLAAATRLSVPALAFVAIGTDVVHMHPSFDGAAAGAGSHRDFISFASEVASLDKGVYINLGSAVIMPEVFLKALSLARNLDNKVESFTTVNMDFIQHYRPGQNVVERPTRTGGKGYKLTGHHEIMFPLLAAAVLEARGGD